MPKTLKNGAVELVQSVTYPKPAPTQKLIQCRYCPAKFENEQGHTVHRKMLHPRVNAHEGTRLLASMRGGGKVAMWPWEGLGLGRCWVARLGTGPAGATVFQLQPKRCSLDDGFSCDDGKSTGRCGAGIRRVYANREKTAAVEKLRRFQKQERAIFEAYRMTPLQYTSKTVGTAESNISKWAKGEALIVEKAATHVSKDLLKNFRLKPRFPLAEKELHTLFRFSLDQRVNVDQVRSREYFYQDILFVRVIFSLFRYATVQYASCGLLEPTMQDFCCCHLVCFVRIAPLLERNSRETFAKKTLSFKGVL